MVITKCHKPRRNHHETCTLTNVEIVEINELAKRPEIRREENELKMGQQIPLFKDGLEIWVEVAE